MSKTIEEVYGEVIASAELQEEYLTAEQEGAEAVVAFAAAHGCEATAEEIEAFLQEKLDEDGEISLDDLDQVAGGNGATSKGKPKNRGKLTPYVMPS
jgi:hypothetical protein